MFDINILVNKEIDNAYKVGRIDMMEEIMLLLAEHNNKTTNYIDFVKELLDLSAKERGILKN